MSAYAVAHLTEVNMGHEIVSYLERIDGTLTPFGGRFVIHGGPVDVREGEFRGAVIAIEFPDRGRATAWYESSEYQKIVPLRANNSEGWVILLDGVDETHRATDVLSA
jgi:uncharacterized protein (DUF1330 family)